VTGLGIVASYSVRFWTLVIGIGVFAGLAASALVELLRLVERLTYGVHRGSLLAAVEAAPSWRRVAGLLVAAVIVTLGLRVLGRASTGGTEVSEAIWLRAGRLAFIPSIARGLLSIVTVGMGVSLGREAAPQLAGAAFASRVSVWANLPVWQRRLLVASGAGAGFAAVYNVPLGGALFALEVLLGAVHLRASQLVFAVLMGPIIGVVATGWTRLITAANRLRPRSVGRWFAPLLVFGALGLLSLQYPQLLGNGRGIVQLALVGNLGIGLLLILLVLKPLVTAACVGSGSPGGLFTPTFALGVLLAGVGGTLWGHIWHGSLPGAYALIGGGAFLAAAMQGPLAGTVLVLELTPHFEAIMVPTLLAVVEATIVSRRLGAASIYSARVAARPEPAAELASELKGPDLTLVLDEDD